MSWTDFCKKTFGRTIYFVLSYKKVFSFAQKFLHKGKN